MNIREAAVQLERAALAYGSRTREGVYRVPLAAQRPLFLVGPPGVGKSAVAAQVAAKLGIGYAAYSMPHHTRQSALGLPLIEHRTLNGKPRAVTEYTMSEIAAHVWDCVEAGAERGILFLDEINCVSESLMPAMLQLLQYKTFGAHPLPRGWMIACAGNPPRYNRYAHTFDAVVMDRLRVIEVEPDLDAWQVYAAQHGVHPAIRSYLRMRGEDFYASDGDRIVTARSWTDLSDVLLAMEWERLEPDEGLFGQYLQAEGVAERFALYYRLCAGIGTRLDGAVAGGGASLDGLPFDESLFAALLLAGRLERMAEACARERADAERVGYFAEGVAREAAASDGGVEALCGAQLSRLEHALEARAAAGILDGDARAEEMARLSGLRRLAAGARGQGDAEALEKLRAGAASALEAAERSEAELLAAFGQTLDFAERAFADPNLRFLFLNDLMSHEPAKRFAQKRLGPRVAEMLSACDPDERARREEI